MKIMSNDLNGLFDKYKMIIITIVLSSYLFINILQSIVQPLWADELYTLWSISFGNLHSFYAESIVKDVHPPLYNFFLYFWVRIFGTSELSVRFPSIIAGLLSIIIFYRTSKRIYNQQLALISSTFMLLFPFLIYFATEARSYSILLLFVIILYNLQHKIFINLDANNKIDLKLGFQLIAVLLTLSYLHYFGLFISCFSFVYFTLLLNFKKIYKISVFYLIFLIGYLPWVSIAIDHASYGKLWMDPLSLKAFYSTLSYILFNNKILSLIPIILLFAYCIKLLLQFIKSNSLIGLRETVRRNSLEIYFLIIIFVPFLIFYVLTHIMTPFFTYKHYFFAIPVLYIILAKSLMIIKNKNMKYGLLVFLLLSALAANIFIHKYTGIYKTDYRAASNYITSKEDSNSNNMIAVYGFNAIEQPAEIYSYYFEKDANVITLHGKTKNIEKLSDSLANSPNPKIWLLADHTFSNPMMISSINLNFKTISKKQFYDIDVLLLQAK